MTRRIKRNTVVPYQDQRGGFSYNNDCGVIALMTLCELTYAQAHQFCAPYRKNGRGMTCANWVKACEAAGFQAVPVSSSKITQRYPERYRHRTITSHHPDRFPEAWTDGNNYLLNVRGHFLGVRDGKTTDWSRNVSRKLKRMFEIIKK